MREGIESRAWISTSTDDAEKDIPSPICPSREALLERHMTTVIQILPCEPHHMSISSNLLGPESQIPGLGKGGEMLWGLCSFMHTRAE